MSKKNILNKALKAWKDLPSNLTQGIRYANEKKDKAFEEGNKIADKMEKGKGTVESTPIPNFSVWSKDPGTMTETDKKKAILRRNIVKQTIDTRMANN